MPEQTPDGGLVFDPPLLPGATIVYATSDGEQMLYTVEADPQVE